MPGSWRRADGRRGRRSATLGVDVAGALNLVAALLRYLSLTFLFPAALALGYGDPVWPFLVSGGVTALAGLAIGAVTRGRERIGPREGFLVASLIWLLVPAFGGLPFLLAEPQLANPVNAYFESVSGFTATGATVLTDIDALAPSMAMWRQTSHWLGGMGIIVLAVAILPRLRVGGRQLLETELAGPQELERLGASIRETARRLWSLYVALTVIAILALAALGWSGADPAMNLYEATAHAFSALALGGFSTKSQSMAAFAPVTQWVVLLFIVLAGINFLRLYRLFVQRHVAVVARDEELRLYLAFLLAGSVLLLVEVLSAGIASGEAAIRISAFHAVSIMTTTGFAVADYTTWGVLALMTLFALMFIGASAGSTGGSIKVVRHLLLFRVVRRELDQTVHREVVVPVRLNGIVVDERALRSLVVFVAVYVAVFVLASVGLAIDERRLEVGLGPFDAMGAVAACLANIGPGFGFAGPFGSYAPFSDLSTGILTAVMWLGRLEIIPVAVLLSRTYWRP
ncbi:MAG: TrkH family potassium uptake protein [Gaiellales bacterium]